MSTTTQRIGQFSIPPDLLRHDWRKLQQFMREIVVVWAQYDFGRDAVSYIAMSDLFDEIPANTATPYYELKFLSVEVRQGDRLCMEMTGNYTLTRGK